MLDFVSKLKETINNETNISITENGALGYATTNEPLVDLNFKVSSYRAKSENEIIHDFMKAFDNDPLLSLKWLFYVRDIRGGLGERRLFRIIVKFLANNYPEIVEKNIKNIPEYGRYDDVTYLYFQNTKIQKTVLEFIDSQLSKDYIASIQNKEISLLAKWLPSPRGVSKTKMLEAKKLRRSLGLTEKEYREVLSHIRKKLNIVEIPMSANKWDTINYETVPAKAHLKYMDAFKDHDFERYNNFITNKSNKVKSGTLYPYEIIQEYIRYGDIAIKEDETIEAMWKNLPLYKNANNTLVVCDTSGSMEYYNFMYISPICIAISLAIYFAEHGNGIYKDKCIEFSARLRFIDMSNCKTLLKKVRKAYTGNCTTTNIEKVFNLILQTAVKNHCEQSDLPENILIISDMEFNSNTMYYDKRLFESIKKKYELYGYNLPQLIFWNVCGRTNTIPMIENDCGVKLISGFSTAAIQAACNNEIISPYENLVKVLSSERYEPITI